MKKPHHYQSHSFSNKTKISSSKREREEKGEITEEQEMENPSSSSTVLHSNLLCQETVISSLFEEQEPDPSLVSLIASNGFSDSQEFVQLLLEKEKTNYSLLTANPQNQSLSPRLSSIKYILKTRELLGFQFQTAYLSITYLDRFLSIRTLQVEKPWAMQLLSVGCLSLAVKMQEPRSLGLSYFQDGGGEFIFDVKAIQRMELLILYTLEWKMGLITPFAYLPYFVSILFTKPPPWINLKRVLDFIMGIAKDLSLMDHYPSSIGLAAVLMSLDERLTRNTLDLKINAIPCSRFLDIEDVCNCYLIMQSKIPKLLSSPDLSPINIRGMVNFKDIPGTSSISSKRKRLEFDGTDDQTQGLRDKNT